VFFGGSDFSGSEPFSFSILQYSLLLSVLSFFIPLAIIDRELLSATKPKILGLGQMIQTLVSGQKITLFIDKLQ